jgi:hypothetical protein
MRKISRSYFVAEGRLPTQESFTEGSEDCDLSRTRTPPCSEGVAALLL